MCTSHLQSSEGRPGFSEEDPANPQIQPFPTPHQALFHAVDPCSCRLVLRFGSHGEFPLDPVLSSPTSLYLNPFVSKISFGVLCLFFSLFHGKLLRMYKYVFSLENRFLYILGLWFLRQVGLQKWRLPREFISGGPSASGWHSFLGLAIPWKLLSFLKPQYVWAGHTSLIIFSLVLQAPECFM